METKALWPTVVIVSVALAFVGTMLIAGVEVTAVVTVFSLIGNLIQVFMYTKVAKIEQHVNGDKASDKRLIGDLIEALKKSPPVKE